MKYCVNGANILVTCEVIHYDISDIHVQMKFYVHMRTYVSLVY